MLKYKFMTEQLQGSIDGKNWIPVDIGSAFLSDRGLYPYYRVARTIRELPAKLNVCLFWARSKRLTGR